MANVYEQLTSGQNADVPALETLRQTIASRVASLDVVQKRLLAAGAFFSLSQQFKTVRPRLFIAAGLAAVGIAGFVMTVGLTKSSRTDAAATQIPVLFTLTQQGQKDLSSILGAGCRSPVEGLLLSGGAKGPWSVVVTDGRCTRGKLTLQPNEARVLEVFGAP